MSHWSWWLTGVSLALVMVLHWLLTGRLMAVSGRFTALVNRVRFGPPEAPSEMSQEELLLALQAATAQEFGSHAINATPAAPEVGCGLSVAPAPEGVALSRPRTTGNHVAFFAALLAGGFAAAFVDGRFAFDAALASSGLRSFAGDVSPLALLGGGLLVGFGTRMAGGCTSGHGLCGVSRFQRGSLAATATFFGAGIAVALLVSAL
jgi:uncharacterized membrane protein YedE/YeeE